MNISILISPPPNDDNTFHHTPTCSRNFKNVPLNILDTLNPTEAAAPLSDQVQSIHFPRASLIMELDNANPTILNVSDLPSNRQRRREKGDGPKKQGVQEILMARPSYSLDPFYLSDFSDGDSSDADSDDSTLEPIDEQEIYGKPHSLDCECFLQFVASSWIEI